VKNNILGEFSELGNLMLIEDMFFARKIGSPHIRPVDPSVDQTEEQETSLLTNLF